MFFLQKKSCSSKEEGVNCLIVCFFESKLILLRNIVFRFSVIYLFQTIFIVSFVSFHVKKKENPALTGLSI
ncbi:hypothetical protein DFO77_1137 [Marinilabilia salmonicolor]|uniref:Uncharacterized protein n=1 Tax=Marinilabilia salmonicolor TaxID=989 RepID=A0A368UWQ2_9BACT|nr:hypothetical protein DFO77_1137 [Marinilabilia salmonicolor]